jgi:hypothetical protein
MMALEPIALFIHCGQTSGSVPCRRPGDENELLDLWVRSVRGPARCHLDQCSQTRVLRLNRRIERANATTSVYQGRI